jgi:nucleoside-diphosphate-sugar epimerase
LSRVLLTGASGFIGRHAIEPLLERGYEVHAVSTKPPPPGNGGVHWHAIDLLDPSATAELLARVRADRLLHLAWDVTPGSFWAAPGNVRWVEASLALMRAFIAAGGERAVLAGTCAEYDWELLATREDRSGAPALCLEENTPLGPHTLYGTSKHATQLVAAALAEQSGVGFAWGRVFHLYGPGEQPGRLVPTVARSLLAGERVHTTEGSQVRDFSHVRDVAAGFVALLAAEQQGPVNIASGNGVTVRSVIELIAAETGKPELVEWGAVPHSPGEPAALVADVRRLAQQVGFVAATPLEEGVRETVAWWRSHGGAL